MITWKLDRKPPSELAALIARDIFSAGDEPHDKVQRIAFKGGSYTGVETDLGGLCEESLARRIDASLKEHLPKGGNGSE